MKNPIVWWELASHYSEKSVKFFEEVFEWEFTLDEKTGIYDLSHESDAERFTGGSVFTLRKAKLPFLTIYIKVENIEEMASKVEKHGGFIKIAPEEVFPGTWICLFNEPSGVTFAMLEKR